MVPLFLLDLFFPLEELFCFLTIAFEFAGGDLRIYEFIKVFVWCFSAKTTKMRRSIPVNKRLQTTPILKIGEQFPLLTLGFFLSTKESVSYFKFICES